MRCRHCGRAVIEIAPLGALYEDDRIHVHADTNLAVCDGDARFRPGYFNAPFAEPESDPTA